MLVRSTALSVAVQAALLLRTPSAAATEPPQHEPRASSYQVSVHGEAHAELFRRALLPGVDGALISTATVVPIRQYVRAYAVDLNPEDGALDFELSGWAGAWFSDTGRQERVADGDVQVANVRYRRETWGLRLGRQQVTGGAARFSRFDGLDLSTELGSGLRAELYAGLTVLPRWNERLGYHYLGAATLADLRSHEVLEEEGREQHRLAGGRLAWSSNSASAGVSFHEQHGRLGLVRRNLGARARGRLFDEGVAGADAVLELDSVDLADARVFLDWTPLRELDASFEYLHTDPGSLLARDSVLSVFGSDAYNEAGASARARPVRFLLLEAAAFAQFRPSGHPGARSELAARTALDASGRSFVRAAYSRLLTPDSGYHSLRTSLRQSLLETLSATLEFYGYFYDRRIRGRRASSVFAGTLSYEPRSPFSAIAGASLVHSPYARLDVQTQVALAYDFDFVTRRRDTR